MKIDARQIPDEVVEAAKVVRIALEEHGDPLATEAADRAIRELIEVCP